ncbi:YjfB family protein [Clostridium sp.]|uniref:YjfB family protein n=1 Tax=Clostridium sp. TaxID=1506 RepID=UPI001A62695F|nr:YjfB family protein [Clostridium sp.]MBK5237086.1 YjfB family protein [Clostridium sp.]
MDIGALSMIMSQSRVQESAGIAVMKMAMNTGKENSTTITDMIKNVAVDSNVGQNLDTWA